MQRRRFLSSAGAVTLASCAGLGGRESAKGAGPGEIDPVRLGFDPDGLRALDQDMANVVAAGEVPGLSYLVARHGAVAAFGVHGLASPQRGAAMRADTLIRIFSMTKPVTGIAMMILFEEGAWRLEDPITRFLPDMARLKVHEGTDEAGGARLVPLVRPPTMGELMSHTAGFGYGATDRHPVDKLFIERRVRQQANLEEMTALVADIPLKYQPGQGWAYSIAVDLQARIVEVITGQSFGEFLKRRIFSPLAMIDTGFFVSAEKAERLADLFLADPFTGRSIPVPESLAWRIPDFFDPGRIQMGGEGLVSTIGDYGRFCQMILNGGALDGVRLLKPETVALMARNRIRPGVIPDSDLVERMGTRTYQFGPGVGFGLDFMVVEDPAPLNIPGGRGMLSWGGAAGTWFWIDPENDLYAIGMIQRLGGSLKATDIPATFRQRLYEALVHPDR